MKLMLHRVFFCACAVLATNAPGQTVSAWTGSAGDGQWATAGNWNPSGVPVAPNEAIVNITATIALPTTSTGSLFLQSSTINLTVPATATISPTYDANGNLTSNGNGQTYTWDAENRLVTVTYSGGAASNFNYDALGQRVSIIEKNSSGTVTGTKQFIWADGRMQEQRDSTGTTVTAQFYSQGEQIGGNKYFYTADHLGSIREITNSTGSIIARYDYDPFGRSTLVSGTNLSDFQYAGMYMHQPSGLNLTLFRAYDPNTGRWLSRDPLAEAAGINLYQYVGNEPVNGIDPDGRYFWLLILGFAAGLSIFIYSAYTDLHPIAEQGPDLVNVGNGKEGAVASYEKHNDQAQEGVQDLAKSLVTKTMAENPLTEIEGPLNTVKNLIFDAAEAIYNFFTHPSDPPTPAPTPAPQPAPPPAPHLGPVDLRPASGPC
jgi:RHS repeat-associated protein